MKRHKLPISEMKQDITVDPAGVKGERDTMNNSIRISLKTDEVD